MVHRVAPKNREKPAARAAGGTPGLLRGFREGITSLVWTGEAAGLPEESRHARLPKAT